MHEPVRASAPLLAINRRPGPDKVAGRFASFTLFIQFERMIDAPEIFSLSSPRHSFPAQHPDGHHCLFPLCRFTISSKRVFS